MKKVAILFVVLLTSSFIFAQNTYVPDDKFEQALIDLGYDTTLDDYVVTANISGVTSLDVSNKEISDLTGIEAFAALTNLVVSNNKLTALDVSTNTALTSLYLYAAGTLTSLDVSKNTALNYLNCAKNQLTSLDVSSNTALISLFCEDNLFTNLDVSKNTTLNSLTIERNQLTSLDVSKNTALTILRCSSNKLTSLDVSNNTALIELDSHNNQLTSLDVSANTALTYLSIGYNPFGSLDVSANTALTYLNIKDNQLTSLDVSQNTALWYLDCSYNQLTSLDVSKNTALKDLSYFVNQVTSIDVSKNTALTNLNSSYNELTSLDVSKNTALESLSCSDNQLTSLNMRNGATDQLSYFDATRNSGLTCIETLDPAYATANWTSANGKIDAGVTFSVICGGTDLTTWYVDTTGSDGSGSGTETSPLATIQTGINAATDSDTISVAAGTYFENINFNGKNIKVVGEDSSNTILDGGLAGSVVTFEIGNGAQSTTPVLKGFTLQNGRARNGGGINIEYTHPEISFVTIKACSSGWGGGIHFGPGTYNASLKNSIITNNTAPNDGGGINVYSNGNGPLISNVIIHKNTGGYGGGMQCYNGSSPTLHNVTITENSANYGGGVLGYGHMESEFTNVLIADNTALNDGGGVLLATDCNTTFTNVTITGNTAGGSGGGIKIKGNSRINLLNSILWNNEPEEVYLSENSTDTGADTITVHYSDIEGGSGEFITSSYSTVIWADGNIDADPRFVKVVTTGDEESDYHLADWSPAIGAGTATGAPTTDIEGNPRPNPAGSNPDLGAFENKWGTPQNAPPVLTALSDVSVNEEESYSDTLRATDEEGDAITYSATSDTSAVTASVTDSLLTLTPKANWNGVANIKAYASDGSSKDSTTFKLTVTPVQDAPTAFDWVSSALDTINITQSNLADTYTLQWGASTDVDGDTINYLIYAKIGLYPTEEVEEITDTAFQLVYEEILEHVFEGRPVNGATVSLNVKATDGIDTVDVTGDNRVIYVNRYEYLSTEGEGVPVAFALHENYPNPFNPTTTLRFDLPEVSDITLTIYNMLGQKVKTFNMQSTPAGYHSINWNATNDFGEQVGAGVYLYQLQTKDFVKTRKMVLLK